MSSTVAVARHSGSLGVALLMMLRTAPAFADAYQTLNAEGGKAPGDGIAIYLGDLLRMQVKREGQTQFYPNLALPDVLRLEFRLALAIGKTTYGARIDGKDFLPISQSISGSGSESDPFVGVTVVEAGSPAVQLREEIRYVVPRDVMSIIVDITPKADNHEELKLYMGGDTFLSGGDTGAGYKEPEDSWPRVVGVTKAGQYMVFVEGNRAFSHYYSGAYTAATSLIKQGGDYNDFIDPLEAVDNGMGVEWNLGAATQPVRITYHLGFTTTPSICGNGSIEGFETCDDGGKSDGDGCSRICQIEQGYRCSLSPSKCSIWCGDGLLRGGEACDDGNFLNGDGCSSDCAVEPLSNCAGEPSVCLFMTGHSCTLDGDCATGYCDKNYSQVCKPLNACGNGLLEAHEVCDDGGLILGDGCGSTCLFENGGSCGSDADCESGVCDKTSESASCEASNSCGNGRIELGEACDDGNLHNDDQCSSSCRNHVGASCQDGNECESDLCNLATKQCDRRGSCGNGLIELGEECDDGATSANDGCSPSCIKESPTSVEPGVAEEPVPQLPEAETPKAPIPAVIPPAAVTPPVEAKPVEVVPAVTPPNKGNHAEPTAEEELIGGGVCSVAVTHRRSSRAIKAWAMLGLLLAGARLRKRQRTIRH